MNKRRDESSRLFRVCAGLPPYGSPAHAFPATFEGSGREGYVVEFLPDTPDAWIGNFAPGLGSYEGVCAHPNGTDIVVFASRQGYVVDPRTHQLKEKIGGAVEHLWPVSDPPGFVLDRQGIAFFRVGPHGICWHTRRLSWDGFKEVAFTDSRITGLAWTPVGERWIPFEVEVATGRSRGGAYLSDDSDDWERLAGR